MPVCGERLRDTWRMMAADRAWLRMDRPQNPMTITGLIILGRRLGRAALRSLIAQRFLALERSLELRGRLGHLTLLDSRRVLEQVTAELLR